MIELLRSTDPAAISFVDALLGDADIRHVIADHDVSVIDGSLGISPTRVLVDRDRDQDAQRLLTDSGV